MQKRPERLEQECSCLWTRLAGMVAETVCGLLGRARGGETDGSSRQIGQRAEELARRHLLAGGYRVVEMNWWAPGRGGEIDIVASKDDVIVAVEVKSFPAGQLTPAEALSREKRRRLVRLIGQYAKQKRLLDRNLRVDLVMVEWVGDGARPRVTQIEGVATTHDA